MAESRVHNQFKLITDDVLVDVGDDVILPGHLSPETSAISMTIRWFNFIECIYLYKNGQVTERTGYEDRLSLNTQELERGNVSLRMKNVKDSDRGFYICQVINGEQKEEDMVEFLTRVSATGPCSEMCLDKPRQPHETQETLQMEKSAVDLEMKMEREEALRVEMEEKGRDKLQKKLNVTSESSGPVSPGSPSNNQ
ncbi:hypothetical protein UPYG_G00302410 [Umbra pygmaea]|uniref:Immunoglobulin domain-containing protein n=1 Tax=Umbra pygmaea TaxID=75934 RepID=A0ABD0W852_UMBPY